MDIGAILAADHSSYFMIGRQEKWPFGYKITVQYTDELNHKIALKLSRK